MQLWQALPEDLSRVAAPLRTVAEFCLAVILAILAARLVWLLIAPISTVAILEDRPLPTMVSTDSTRITADRSVLVRLNPFETTAGDVIDIPDAPETKLNLRLAGLIMTTDAFGGSAQITTPDNQTGRYGIGDEVLPGVELDRVLSDRVLLNRNGTSETLMLGNRGEGLSVIGDGNQVAAASDDEASNPQTIEGRVSSSADLIQTIQPSPVNRNGRLYGYSLSLRGSAEALVATGLASGDILLQVNGTPVSQMDIVQMTNEISAQSTVSLDIERAGVPMSVNLLVEE